jgi:hypothetical protein
MLGQNLQGRYLLAALAHIEGDAWRVVTAYWLRESRGRRLYREG